MEKMRASLHVTAASSKSNEKTYFVEDDDELPTRPEPNADKPKTSKRAEKNVRKAYGNMTKA